jgi:hypothetical protein
LAAGLAVREPLAGKLYELLSSAAQTRAHLLAAGINQKFPIIQQ